EELAPLKELAYNLWHAWNPEALTLFMRVDRELWEKCNHNPVLMLGRVEQDRLNKLANDDGFLSHLKRTSDEFHRYVEYRRFFQFALGVEKDFRIAYFSAEFGVNDSIPNYSGGLGVLAGDHIKSASDLNVPLVGMGLMYQQGYFRQYLTSDGWQQELYPENDFHNMPLRLMRNPENNEPLTVYVPMKNRQVATRIWKLS
ncbi:MAG: glycosyltransferase family 1 protein, partial [Desulfuromonadales bacterium]|nr:glycosyltransferase family 1 protein [Desulfuromonadales bacterium]